MTKASPILSSFNAGEFSPLLEGRTDYAKYPKGLRKMVNFQPTTQGPAVRRGGTRFVSEVKDSSKRANFVKFQFSVSQAYQLEFGDRYVRFFTNHGQVITSGVAAYNGATAYVVGDLVTSGGITYYCIAATTGNSPPNATYWYAQSGNIYEIPSPYLVADLFNDDGVFAIHYAQSADVIYLFHPKYPPQKLSRFGATRWTISPVNFLAGPFDDQNDDRTQFISVGVGGVTLLASIALFTADMVGSLIYLESKDFSAVPPWQPTKQLVPSGGNPNGALRRVDQRVYRCDTNASAGPNGTYTGTETPTHTSGSAYDGDQQAIANLASNAGVLWTFLHPGYAVFKITAFTSTTQVSVALQSDWAIPADYVSNTATLGTWRWALPKWTSGKGWPDLVTFFRNRLVAARSNDQSIVMSVVADYENLASKDFGDITSDMAISIEVAADQEYNALSWISSGAGLLIGTVGGEFLCAEQTTNDVFGPDNVKIEKQSGYGSRSIDPISAGSAVVYVQKGGRQLMQMEFNIQSNTFESDDKSVPAEHLMYGGITQMAFQKETDSIIWSLRADGLLLGFTYNPKQDVFAWAQYPVGGDGIVESISVMPAPTLDRSELWLIVRRTINGQTKRYVEYMERPYRQGDNQSSAFYVDCGLTYSGAPATVISGLSHLEGQSVTILTDGATHPDRVVLAGAITLDAPGAMVNVGLKQVCRLVPERLDAGGADGTSQGKTKRITKVVFRFYNSLGGVFGPQDGPFDDILTRSGDNNMDQAPPLLTGDTDALEWPNGYDFDGVVEYRNEQPLPVTVVAIMPQVVTQDR